MFCILWQAVQKGISVMTGHNVPDLYTRSVRIGFCCYAIACHAKQIHTLLAPARSKFEEPSQASSKCSLVLANLPEMIATADAMPGSM